MNGNFLYGIEEAYRHVECHPGYGKPPCPVMAQQEEDAGNHREQAQQGGPEVFPTKVPLCDELPQMNRGSENAGSDEQAGNEGDRQRALVHVSLPNRIPPRDRPNRTRNLRPRQMMSNAVPIIVPIIKISMYTWSYRPAKAEARYHCAR